MAVDHIRYDLMVREALRGVVRRVIADVAKNGLPGDHHFYISFNTGAPGVRISPRLRAQYPAEMTIVLQHQFWDLSVTETGIEVGLSFGGVPERLSVPFDALKGFFDPSVQFGLEFEVSGETAHDVETRPSPRAGALAPSASKPPARTARGSRRTREADVAPPEPAAEPSDKPAEPAKQDGGAEVVRLDRFRKK